MPKFNLGQILNIAALAQSLVESVKDKFSNGKDKKAAVVASLKEALVAVEAATGKNLLDDEKFNEALDALIEAEVAVQKAKARVESLIKSAK